MDEQSPGTSTNVCGFLSVFMYRHLRKFENTTHGDRQDRTGITFFIKCSSDLYRVTGFDQPANACHDWAIDLVGAIPGRVLDDVPKLHNDQWVIRASLVIPGFCNEAT